MIDAELLFVQRRYLDLVRDRQDEVERLKGLLRLAVPFILEDDGEWTDYDDKEDARKALLAAIEQAGI